MSVAAAVIATHVSIAGIVVAVVSVSLFVYMAWLIGKA